MKNKPKINHYIGLPNTPAFPYAHDAFNELLKDGLTENRPFLQWDDNAITALLDGAIVGVMIWAEQAWTKTIFVKLGWVSPKFRRQGIYKALWKEVVKIAQDKKMVDIMGATDIRNKAMRAVAKSQGRKETVVTFQYFV